jgi:sugar-specific transcriptional regulator TrmB
MTIESLSKRVMSFGLSEEESKYYLFISLMGPIPISNVVRRYGTNRVKIYRSLEKLVEKGFLEKIIGRPVLYVAKPLGDILTHYIENLQKKISELENSKEVTLNEWNKIYEGLEKPLEEPRFRIHQGRNQVYNLLINMCERAEKEVLFVTTESDLHRLALFGFDDSIIKIAEKGVRFNFITQVESMDFEEIGGYYQFASMRHVLLPSPVRILVIDGSDVLVTVQMDDSMNMTTQSDTGIWTNAESLVSVMSIFFQALWKLASDIPAVLYEMKTGTKIQKIVTLKSHEEYIDYTRKSLQRCKSSLDLMLSHDDPEVLSMIKDTLHPEIDSRIITHITLNNIVQYDDFTNYTKIRHNSTLNELHLLIIDKTEIIVSLPSWKKTTQSVWSNNIHYVDSMHHVFKDKWNWSEPMNDVIKRLQKEEKTVHTISYIESKLRENNFIVESPGIIRGISGTNHVFGLVAYNKGTAEAFLGVDALGKKEQMSQISHMGAKRTDLQNMKIILLSNIKPSRHVNELAKLFRIQILNETQIIEDINDIMKQNG